MPIRIGETTGGQPAGPGPRVAEILWYVVRTAPHQETKLRDLLLARRAAWGNILEVYCPTRTTLHAGRGGRAGNGRPLCAGCVFVLAERQALTDFLARHYPRGVLLFERRADAGLPARPRTVPEAQMRFFMDFNENYADRVVVLERPYTDYAFNPKTGQPNEIIRVIDGPLAGRTGYLTRFRGDRRLVFNIRDIGAGRDLAVSIPDVWRFRCVRLHNAGADRQSLATRKDRAADFLLGLVQGCGYGERSLEVFHRIVEQLAANHSISAICRSLSGADAPLSAALARLAPDEAALVLDLARYESDAPGYARRRWPRPALRPFLTPTSGVPCAEGCGHAELRHPGYTEIIRPERFAEPTYFPATHEERSEPVCYYAHIGHRREPSGRHVLFANWDVFLGEYFLTAGQARRQLLGRPGRQLESFARYAPTLHEVLAGQSAVRALEAFDPGDGPLSVLAVVLEAPGEPAEEALREAADRLVATGIAICREISSTPHLAVWRRYLRSVWLHR